MALSELFDKVESLDKNSHLIFNNILIANALFLDKSFGSNRKRIDLIFYIDIRKIPKNKFSNIQILLLLSSIAILIRKHPSSKNMLIDSASHLTGIDVSKSTIFSSILELDEIDFKKIGYKLLDHIIEILEINDSNRFVILNPTYSYLFMVNYSIYNKLIYEGLNNYQS